MLWQLPELSLDCAIGVHSSQHDKQSHCLSLHSGGNFVEGRCFFVRLGGTCLLLSLSVIEAPLLLSLLWDTQQADPEISQASASLGCHPKGKCVSSSRAPRKLQFTLGFPFRSSQKVLATTTIAGIDPSDTKVGYDYLPPANMEVHRPL